MIMESRDRKGWLNIVFCDDDRVVGEKERELRDKDEDDVEDTSWYEKSGVPLASLGWEDLISV